MRFFALKFKSILPMNIGNCAFKQFWKVKYLFFLICVLCRNKREILSICRAACSSFVGSCTFRILSRIGAEKNWSSLSCILRMQQIVIQKMFLNQMRTHKFNHNTQYDHKPHNPYLTGVVFVSLRRGADSELSEFDLLFWLLNLDDVPLRDGCLVEWHVRPFLEVGVKVGVALARDCKDAKRADTCRVVHRGIA